MILEAGNSLMAILSLGHGMQPTGFGPLAQQFSGVATQPRKLRRCERALIGEATHQRSIAAGRTKRLTVDEDVAIVVQHASAPVEAHALPLADRPATRFEPDLRLGLAQHFAQRAGKRLRLVQPTAGLALSECQQ